MIKAKTESNDKRLVSVIITYNADTFDGEYHSREEARQLLYRREHVDAIDRMYVAEDIVERDREAGHHEDIGQHRERYHVF